MNAPIRHSGCKMWKGPDPEVRAAANLPGWAAFHRECGQQGLSFDDIERVGRSRRFTAVTYRLEKVRSHFAAYQVSKGSGDSVVAAVLDAFDAAVAAGFRIADADRLRALLTEGPAPVVRVITPPAVSASLSSLLGDAEEMVAAATGVSLEALLG